MSTNIQKRVRKLHAKSKHPQCLHQTPWAGQARLEKTSSNHCKLQHLVAKPWCATACLYFTLMRDLRADTVCAIICPQRLWKLKEININDVVGMNTYNAYGCPSDPINHWVNPCKLRRQASRRGHTMGGRGGRMSFLGPRAPKWPNLMREWCASDARGHVFEACQFWEQCPPSFDTIWGPPGSQPNLGYAQGLSLAVRVED